MATKKEFKRQPLLVGSINTSLINAAHPSSSASALVGSVPVSSSSSSSSSGKPAVNVVQFNCGATEEDGNCSNSMPDGAPEAGGGGSGSEGATRALGRSGNDSGTARSNSTGGVGSGGGANNLTTTGNTSHSSNFEDCHAGSSSSSNNSSGNITGYVRKRHGSFLYKSTDSVSNAGSTKTSFSSGMEEANVVTPFAQILSAMTRTKNNLSKIFQDCDGKEEIKNQKDVIGKSVDDLEACLKLLSEMRTHQPISDMTAAKFMRMLSHQLQQVDSSEHSDEASGSVKNKVSDFIVKTYSTDLWEHLSDDDDDEEKDDEDEDENEEDQENEDETKKNNDEKEHGNKNKDKNDNINEEDKADEISKKYNQQNAEEELKNDKFAANITVVHDVGNEENKRQIGKKGEREDADASGGEGQDRWEDAQKLQCIIDEQAHIDNRGTALSESTTATMVTPPASGKIRFQNERKKSQNSTAANVSEKERDRSEKNESSSSSGVERPAVRSLSTVDSAAVDKLIFELIGMREMANNVLQSDSSPRHQQQPTLQPIAEGDAAHTESTWSQTSSVSQSSGNLDFASFSKLISNNSMNKWDLDIFALNDVTSRHPLAALGFKILKSRKITNQFCIPDRVLFNYLARVEGAYRSTVPYHNNLHGCDVMHTINVMCNAKKLDKIFSKLELFSVIVAGAVHDVDHPGLTNEYLIETSSPMALLYNDISILENHHASTAFSLMLQQQEGDRDGAAELDCNILQNMQRKDRLTFRELVIDLILATDLKKHHSLLGEIKTMIETFKVSGITSVKVHQRDRNKILQMMIHCADVSNPSKPWDLYMKWTERIMAEFYRQGDEERARGMPISAMFDRYTTNINACQEKFIEFIAYPLWETWAELVEPEFEPILQVLNENKAKISATKHIQIESIPEEKED